MGNYNIYYFSVNNQDRDKRVIKAFLKTDALYYVTGHVSDKHHEC